MANLKFIGLIAAVVFLSAFTMTSTMSWNIDENHSIQFSTKKAKGHFEDFTGTMLFDEDNLRGSRFDVQIDVKSIKTGNWLKNKHARGKNWFNSEEYPSISFSSNTFSKTSGGYEVSGMLEIRGTQKEITMPFTFTDNIFKSTFTVNRTDFKVGKTTGMAKSVGHEITLDIAVPVSKKLKQ